MIGFVVRSSIPAQSSRELIKLATFSELPSGWHYGSGGPISADVIDNARKIYRFYRLVGFSRTNFFAGADGDVLATAYHLDHYLGVDIEPTGLHSIIYERNGSEIFCHENLNLSRVRSAILEASVAIWNISDSVHPGDYDFDRGKFNDLAFKNSTAGGGLSIFDTECAKRTSVTICAHIRIFYPLLTGEPPVSLVSCRKLRSPLAGCSFQRVPIVGMSVIEKLVNVTINKNEEVVLPQNENAGFFIFVMLPAGLDPLRKRIVEKYRP